MSDRCISFFYRKCINLDTIYTHVQSMQNKYVDSM